MHPTFRVARRTLAGLLACGLACGGAAAGQEAQQPQPQPPAVGAQPPEVKPSFRVLVPIGGTRELRMQTSTKPLKSAKNEKDQVATLAPTPDARVVSVSGLAAGTTLVTLTDQDNKVEVIEVVVQLDIDFLRSLLERAVPTSNVHVIPGAGNTIILAGTVTNAVDVETIIAIANSVVGGGVLGTESRSNRVINALTVGGVQQVQLDVTVAQVNRTEARRRGFNFAVAGTTANGASIIGGISTPAVAAAQTTATIGTLGIIPTAAPNGPNLIFGLIPAGFTALLQALKDEGVSKLLAEPKLVTLSGRPARFLAGGRQAVLSPSSGINGPGATYEEIGTELDFLPIVLGNGKIYLEVLPRVRSVNNALGITTSFGFTPGFDEQSVRTAVMMEPDQTFAIGGLIQNSVQSTSSKVPVLGELPIVGAAFSQVLQTETEQELVILVTPHLVDPQDHSQVNKKLPGRETRSASDFELYLESLMEAPRGPRHPFVNKRYVAAWKNDPTAQSFPCGESAGCGTGACGAGRLTGGCSTCTVGALNPVVAVPVATANGPTMPPLPATVSAPPATVTVDPAGLQSAQPLPPAFPASADLGAGTAAQPLPRVPAAFPPPRE
jgi:pilus assembly protein CpaC